MTSERFVLSSALVDRLQQGGVDPYRNDPGGSATHGSSSPAAQLVNVVALLGLNAHVSIMSSVTGTPSIIRRPHDVLTLVAVDEVPSPRSPAGVA